MSVDIVTPFDFDNEPLVSLGTKKFISTVTQPGVITPMARKPTQLKQPSLDDNTSDDDRAKTTEKGDELVATSVTSKFVTFERQGPFDQNGKQIRRPDGKPTKIVVFDWKSERMNTNKNGNELPSIVNLLRQKDAAMTERQNRMFSKTKPTETKRKQPDVYFDINDIEDDMTSDQKRYAHNRRVIRGAQSIDDNEDPLAEVTDEQRDEDNISRIINEMNDF